MKRGKIIGGVLLLAAMATAGMLYPIHGTLSKAATMLGLAGLAVAAIALSWRRRYLCIAIFLILATMVVPFCLPGRPADGATLRNRYVANLKAFENTRYVWGGENSLGIDCSGLPRRAYRDALLFEGLRTLNSCLTRAWVSQWWNDAGARDMAQCDRGRLTEVTLQWGSMASDDLEPGDIAVVNGDTHVLVNLGHRTWIEADPEPGKVLIRDANEESRLCASPKFFRWCELRSPDTP